jgi:hypothetical protein
MQKAVAIDRAQANELIEEFLQDYVTWFMQPNGPTEAQMRERLSNDFQLSSNGQLIVRSLKDYADRIMHLRDRYKTCHVTALPGQTKVYNHTAIFSYEVHFTSAHHKDTHLFIMAVVEFDDHKIHRWTQATHEKGLPHWDDKA